MELPPPKNGATLDLSILMPCLNEAWSLSLCIEEAKEYLTASRLSGEIVIADNGSTDGSLQIAEAAGVRVVKVATRGYGSALIAGAKACHGKWIIFGDADATYDFAELGPFVSALSRGTDLVVGNRFRGGIEPGAMPFLNRYLGNPVLSLVGRILFPNPCRDFHCGLRGVLRASFEKMALRCEGMEFASEMIVRATVLGMRISEVPTVLRIDHRDRKPHLRPWRDGLRHLHFLASAYLSHRSGLKVQLPSPEKNQEKRKAG